MPDACPAVPLTASPNFALCHAADGSAYVIGETEPYPQYWLDEDESLLFALFGRQGGVTAEAATEALIALAGDDVACDRSRLRRSIAEMVEAGVLIAPGGELSRYDGEMAPHYLANRPFPTAIADDLARQTGLAPGARVLDLASGPGTLALELARRGAQVAIMELSRGFVDAACAEAGRRGLEIEAINESCNRLAQHDGRYDLITISQALHWLDDVAVCRGVRRTLAPGGSFVVVHSAMSLSHHHPLAWVLGDHTPLGDKSTVPFDRQAAGLFRRVSLLLEALETPGVQGHHPDHAAEAGIRFSGAGITLYRQQRPIDEGFARAFMSPRHVEAFDMTPDAFWARVAECCSKAAPYALMASMDWAVLRFRRGASLDQDTLQGDCRVQDIPYP